MTTSGPSEAADFSQVAELPFHKATREQLSMMYTRYSFAAGYVTDRSVLEVACGGGLGLGYLARFASAVHGIDIDPHNLAYAQQRYRSNAKVTVELIDARSLPYADAQYDVVILFDSIYFLREPLQVLQEAVRVLRPGGQFLVSTVNTRWDGFHPSPRATRYFRGEEIVAALRGLGCEARAFGAFPTRERSFVGAALSIVRRLAVRWRLIPYSVRAKERLKRLFMGELREFGPEVQDGMARPAQVIELSAAETAGDGYKILYFVGTKHGASQGIAR